ncbi:MAG TPA: hypothetical protein VH497_14360 [Vicinamibacterales bacterium]
MAVLILSAGVATSSAHAQAAASWAGLAPEPISFADGHVTIGGDVSATFGSEDPGFFNYTDYEHSALRMLRLNVTAAVRANDHLALLGDLQTENFDGVQPYALYVRIKPWTTHDVDIQAGRIPPTFGAFSRRAYVSDNPLIGYPLSYQYLSSLRPDSLPATADELLQKKSFGWLVRYSIGSAGLDHGVPVVTALRWDTGVQVHASVFEHRTLSMTASVTSGTLSNPLFHDDNGGKQVAGRLEWRPTPGLTVGTSASHGDFVSTAAATAALAVGRQEGMSSFAQTAWGVDAEYSRNYLLIRTEIIGSAWRIPFADEPTRRDPLDALTGFVEGRYKIKPGLYAAARFDHLGFGTITGATLSGPWDAPVNRIEVGAGYSLFRNLLLKGSYQHDTRDGGRLAPTANLVATQVVFWF